MRLVVIESPYRGAGRASASGGIEYDKGDVARNELYLRFCIRDAALRGDSPYASHRMLPGALDDDLPNERQLGIALGLMWRRASWVDTDGVRHVVVPIFYEDLGYSDGMRYAKDTYDRDGIAYEVRKLPADSEFWTLVKLLPNKKGLRSVLLGPKTREFFAKEIAERLDECVIQESRLAVVTKGFPLIGGFDQLAIVRAQIADYKEALRELEWL